MSDLTVVPDVSGSPRSRRHRVRNAFVIVIALLAVVGGSLFLKPAAVAAPVGPSHPASTRDEGLSRIEEVQAAEAGDRSILPSCRTRLYDQGAESSEVIVLFHGYTNCPKQYDVLAQRLADKGYTVLVPRMPHHGQVPGTPGLLDSLTGEQVAAYADSTMDIAAGLADRVTVFGLSGGGAVASYIAQTRGDVDRIVAAAAFLSTPAIPGWLVPAAINLIDLLPAIDQREPAPDEGARGAFPHGASDTSTHGAAAYMRLGQTVLGAASTEAPKAGRIVTVINEADSTVNNALVEDLAQRWARLAPDRTSVYRFDASQHVLHDMITPDREGQETDLVYPVIIGLLTGT